MNENIILYMMIGAAVMLAGIVVAFLLLKKKTQSSDIVQIRQLRKGTKEQKFSKEILYQKLYVRYLRSPFIKRYLFKIRRRLEIINIDDEYLTRKQTSEILTKAIVDNNSDNTSNNIYHKKQWTIAIDFTNI